MSGGSGSDYLNGDVGDDTLVSIGATDAIRLVGGRMQPQ
ncbi:hypothetical protein ACF8R4_08705 [Pseudomonas sp. FYR_2]